MADQEQVPDPQATPDPSAEASPAPADDAADALAAAKDAVDDLSRQAATAAVSTAGTPLDLPAFPDHAPGADPETIDLLADVSLNVKIELGRTSMLLEDVLRLGEGAVVELDKLAGDPVDIYVNNRPVARGEVLVMNDNFCVRVHEILADTGPTKPGSPRTGK